MTIHDLTLPYFDLVGTNKKSDSILEQEKTRELHSETANDNQENPLVIWLIVLGIIDIGLIGLLVTRKKK